MMSFASIYRVSFYAMLTLATLVLSIDATDNPIAMLYPLVVAASGLVAWLTVDRPRRELISRNLASLIGVASVFLCILEYQYDNNLFLLATAHWLVYLQLVKIFLPKTVEDDWFLFLLGLAQVLVGGVMSQSDQVGFALFCWALTSLWVLRLFSLRREEIRLDRAPMAYSADGSNGPGEPYRGLFDTPFLLSSARVAAITLAMGGLIFLAMPRFALSNNSRSNGMVGKHLSGFDDEVQLGQLGEILENDSVVLSIEEFREDGSRVVPSLADPEQRWRGLSLVRYDRGRWRRSNQRMTGFTMSMPSYPRDAQYIRQIIKAEPTDSPILFVLRPFFDVKMVDSQLNHEVNEIDGSLFRSDTRVVPFEYHVISSTNGDLPQPSELFPQAEYLGQLRAVPPDVLQVFRPIAEKVVEGFAPDDYRGRARMLESYLRDSGQFSYSLEMTQVDRSVDPAIDFLVNRKEGHCEYFATALTLLLRSIDIPARLVNGFKGGDYNPMAGMITVRQKHAHSWVEALVDRSHDAEGKPIYQTLDPTPADQRNASVAKVGGITGRFHVITDFIRYVWVFYIVGFNAERQDRVLYQPILKLIAEARRGFSMMGQALMNLFHFPSVESFFSLRGFLVSFSTLLILVGLVRLLQWTLRRVYRRFSPTQDEDDRQLIGVQFYRSLLEILNVLGLERLATETPREFARRAAAHLSTLDAGLGAVADVPPLVVDAFYRTRYGEHEIPADHLEQISARLDALGSKIRVAT